MGWLIDVGKFSDCGAKQIFASASFPVIDYRSRKRDDKAYAKSATIQKADFPRSAGQKTIG